MLTLMPLATEESRYVHMLSQSGIGSFLTCNELGRKYLRKELPPDETEASARGRAVHAGIDAVLNDCVGPDEALAIAFSKYRTDSLHPAFRMVKHKKESTVLGHIEGGFASWWDYVYPTLKASVWVEHPFRFLLHEDDERLVYLRGVADYAEVGRVDDWKVTTNKDKYSETFGGDGWEQKRWSIQATAYCAAYNDAFGVIPEFRFVALDVAGRKPQLLTVERTASHIDFLAEQCVTIAQQLERGNNYRYPLNDQHALCSPKWCANWSQCKGEFFADTHRSE